jgi:hypothetical protein
MALMALCWTAPDLAVTTFAKIVRNPVIIKTGQNFIICRVVCPVTKDAIIIFELF